MKHQEKILMKDYFIKANISLSEKQLNQFEIFYDLFIKYNEEYDLSRLTDFHDIIIKHFIDSAIISKMYSLPSSLVDIGTGPGFPGIPLKILNPNLKIILAEPRHKRVKFMNMVIDELNLENISTYPHKVNDESFFEVDGIITRAFEEINTTLLRADKFLKIDGKIIFLKGPNVDRDFQNISANLKEKFTIEHDSAYSLLKSNQQRRLVVYSKLTNTYEKTFLMMNEFPFDGIEITSSENKKIKSLKKYFSKINKSPITSICGKKFILEAVKKYPHLCDELFIYERYRETSNEFLKILDDFEKRKKLYLLKKSLFNDIDILSANAPILSITKPEIIDFEFTKKIGNVLALSFQDPQNIGSIIRSAAAFGFNNILLLKNSCDPFHPKSIRSSGGAVFSVNFYKGPSITDLAENCKDNYSIISLDSKGKPLSELKLPENFILLPGIEGPGLPEKYKHDAVSIQMTENVESLNAATAASIVMHHCFTSRK